MPGFAKPLSSSSRCGFVERNGRDIAEEVGRDDAHAQPVIDGGCHEQNNIGLHVNSGPWAWTGDIAVPLCVSRALALLLDMPTNGLSGVSKASPASKELGTSAVVSHDMFRTSLGPQICASTRTDVRRAENSYEMRLVLEKVYQ